MKNHGGEWRAPQAAEFQPCAAASRGNLNPGSAFSSTKRFFVFFLTAVLSAGIPASAVEPGDSAAADSLENKDRLYPLPLLFWTPQTKLGGGLSLLYVLRNGRTDSIGRPNTWSASSLFTQKKQLQLSVAMDRYWDEFVYRLSGSAGYMKFPDYFYGIGPDTRNSWEEAYTPESFYVTMDLRKQVRQHIYVGGLADFRWYNVIKDKAGGLFDTQRVRGEKAGVSSGLGAAVQWDSRDHTLWPRSGSFHQVTIIPYHEILASDYRFVALTLDLRHYWPLFDRHVIACQFYGKFIKGEPPFYRLASFDGVGMLRGYYPERYRDRNMIGFQAEYRMPLFWRVGLAGFWGYGDVAPHLMDFRVYEWKYSAGIGIRFLVSRKDRTNLRLDLAVGHRSAYPVLGIGEAF